MESLHINTPLIESLPLGKLAGCRVWLKMDALQPSGSFKLRGIGHACSLYKEQGAKKFIASSGGNAGLAVAYAGRKLGVPVTVVVPETTKPRAVELIKREGAKVIIHGKNWNEAHKLAMSFVDERAAYLHPFDDPNIWEGHGTIIDEVVAGGLLPGRIVLSVGGGGLLCGVSEGLKRNGLENVPITAVETEGAASLAAAVSAGKHIAISGIESIATSLGAVKVAEKAFHLGQSAAVDSLVVSDRQAVEAVKWLVDEHRLLVEPACGAAIAALFAEPAQFKGCDDVLVIICGGVGVSPELLQSWCRQFAVC